MIEYFAASRQGASHIKKNKPCQDASGCFIGEKDEKYHLAVVADGHGSDEYFRSDRGSRFAVEVTHKVIDHFIKQHTGTVTDEHLQNIEKAIIDQWQKMVLADIKNSPWTNEELSACKQTPSAQDVSIYGTTLLAIAMTPRFWLALQIGDGGCVIIDAGGSYFAVADDDSQGMGSTHSLCEQNALQHFRHTSGTDVPLGAIVATDGVLDSINQDIYLSKFTVNILKAFVKHPDKAKTELEIEVLPALSKQGSQDDVSIACIFNVDAARPKLKRIIEISEKQSAASNNKMLEKENSKLKMQVSDLTSNNARLQTQVSDLTAKLQKTEEERSRLSQGAAKLKQAQPAPQKTQPLAPAGTSFEAENKNLTAQVSELKTEKSTLLTKLNSAAQEKNRLEIEKQATERSKAENEKKMKFYKAAMAAEGIVAFLFLILWIITFLQRYIANA